MVNNPIGCISQILLVDISLCIQKLLLCNGPVSLVKNKYISFVHAQ